MDKVGVNFGFSHTIEEVLSLDNSSKITASRPITCIPAGEEQA